MKSGIQMFVYVWFSLDVLKSHCNVKYNKKNYSWTNWSFEQILLARDNTQFDFKSEDCKAKKSIVPNPENVSFINTCRAIKIICRCWMMNLAVI